MRTLLLGLVLLIVVVIGWLLWEIRSDRRYLSQYRPPTIRRNRDRIPPMD